MIALQKFLLLSTSIVIPALDSWRIGSAGATATLSGAVKDSNGALVTGPVTVTSKGPESAARPPVMVMDSL